jgi:YD repeat-containing protein
MLDNPSNGIITIITITTTKGNGQGKITNRCAGTNCVPRQEICDFNNRLEPANITVATPGGQVQNVTYGFTDANGNNNGNVMSITNNLDGTRSPTYTYDSLNRIKTAGTSVWSQNFSSGIDRWGNLTQVTATGGAPTLSQTVDTSTNRLKASCVSGGLCYDAAGNMTSDGLYNYAYDAEGHQTSANGVAYSYDGLGRRVERGSAESRS